MKKITPNPTEQMNNFSFEEYLFHALIVHEKDWQKIRKLAKSHIKKARA